MPLSVKEAKELVRRRSPEWQEHALRWRWLLDSLEGGQRYRLAVYGRDRHGLPVRNLARHKRERPDPRESLKGGQPGSAVYLGGTANGMAGNDSASIMGSDQYQFIDDDDYSLRLARTPVPTFVTEVVDTYIAKVFETEVDRDAPKGGTYDDLSEWWTDTDGRGTTIDDWMRDTVGPLILTFGHLDLYFDRPAAPEGEDVSSLADVTRLGLDRVVGSYILPENMVWWKLDPLGLRYIECLHLEYGATADAVGEGEGTLGVAAAPDRPRYRHWTETDTTVYDEEGFTVSTFAHNYGFVPIRRVFDRRKPRCQNVGMPLMECAAEIQREYYNRDSELILSDTTQAHPLLQGPEDFVEGDGSIPVGPGWMLPMKRNPPGMSPSYTGFQVVDFPKGAAESLRHNKSDLRDALDRYYSLMKPAGAAKGGGGGTVSQSGISKGFDHDALYSKLAKVAQTLAKAEMVAVELVLSVLNGAPPPDFRDQVEVTYPTTFSLHAGDELAAIAADFQALLDAAGNSPEVETAILNEIVRKALPGRDDDTYETWSKEIEDAVMEKAKAKEQAAEGLASGTNPDGSPTPADTMKTLVTDNQKTGAIAAGQDE